MIISMIGSLVHAQKEQRFYGKVRGWEVNAGLENGQFSVCGMNRPQNTNDIAMLLSWDGVWEIGFPTTQADGATVYMDAILDQHSARFIGRAEGGYAVVQANADWVRAVSRGHNLWLELDGQRHHISLHGTAAAIRKVKECVSRYNKAPSYAAGVSQPSAPVTPARPVESDAARMGVNCPAYGSYRSPNVQDWGAVEFVNFTDRALGVYWIDYNGQNVEMGSVLPDQSVKFTSYAGHYWIVKDFNATCYGGVWTLNQGENRIEIQ